MNEVQIIQNQLGFERAHFAEVLDACTRGGRADGVSAAAGEPGRAEFIAACTDYFAFALTRFEPRVAEVLAAQLAKGLAGEFPAAFAAASRDHFSKLDAMLARNRPVTEWRAVSRIDADSIFAERARYARVKATIPI